MKEKPYLNVNVNGFRFLELSFKDDYSNYHRENKPAIIMLGGIPSWMFHGFSSLFTERDLKSFAVISLTKEFIYQFLKWKKDNEL